MSSRKRHLSPDSPGTHRTKKLATAPVVVSDDDDDEESLESILTQIKAHEESEALARRLQEQWNAPGPSTSRAQNRLSTVRDHSTPEDAIEISDDEGNPEGDEAMARRLARQWELEDSSFQLHSPPHSSTTNDLPQSTSAWRGKTKARPDNQLPPSVTRLEQCKDLFTGVKTCPCGAELPSPRGHVVFSETIPSPSLLRTLHAPCTSCKTNHCRGCMTSVPCPLSCKGGSAGEANCPVQTCCTNVRTIAIFEALGGFDRQYIGEREVSDQRAREATAKAQKNQVGSVGPGGTGYGMDSNHGWKSTYNTSRGRGRGRGRNRGRGGNSSFSELSHIDAIALHFDEVIVRALNTITAYLPAPYSDDPQMYDLLPHQSLDALFSLSQLPDLLGNLLRNDSVTDWIARSDVYHAMLGLLRRMADCELTLEVLTGPRWEMSKSCGLEEWMWGDGQIIWERDVDAESALVQAPPLYIHFKKLTKQCEAFLAGASSLLESGEADGDAGDVAEMAVKATSLCGDIIAAKDGIERAMAVMGKNPAAILRGLEDSGNSRDSSSPTSDLGPTRSDNGKGKGKDPAIDLERTYAQECERLAFQYVTLSDGTGTGYPTYQYAKELQQTANATRNPRDRLHLVKELAVTATSLPPGVWVRVDEVRNDAIKIMIAGPEGTPYAGGLFEFDCFIPLEYPNKPPLMHLRTTGGGLVRFNPNLYNTGKVCLSLLGTWPGRPEEQWSPKATLLQVLVSIQSMILIDLPYFNEPGFGKANPDSPLSIAYNKNICLQTTRWAIVEWLREDYRDGIWGDVIASHFLTRHEVIKKCIQDWAKTQPYIHAYQSSSAHFNHMGMGWTGFGTVSMPPPIPLPSYHSGQTPAPPDLMNVDPPVAFTGTFAAQSNGISSHALWTGQKHESKTPSQTGRDLLKEYDIGIQKIRGWKKLGESRRV